MVELLGRARRGPDAARRARRRARRSCGARSPSSASSRSTSRSTAAALDGHPGAAPFSWDVAGKANVARDVGAGGAGRRPLADPVTATSTSSAPSRRRSGAGRPVRRPPRRRLALRPRRGRHEVAGSRRSSAPCAACAGSGSRRAGASSCSRSSRRSARATARSRACWRATRADAAILTEPTRGAIWNAQVGVLWFQVRVARRARPRRRRARGRQRDRGVDGGDRGAARARGRAQRRQAAALRRLSAPDQPQRRDDPRRRLALDGRRRVPDALPARALSRASGWRTSSSASSRRSPGSRRASRAERLPHRGALRRLRVRGLRARAGRAARHRRCSTPPSAPPGAGRRCSPRPRRRTRAASSSTATRRPSASARSPSTSTASTSASTCPR